MSAATHSDAQLLHVHPASTGRIAGIDLARGLAIVGMLAVHVGPTNYGSLAGRLYALPHGRASILFVLVAGVGVSLLAASRRATLADARLKLGWTALLLLPLGLALQDLNHGILVVLQGYALLFVLGVAVLGLSDRALLMLAAGFAFLGPLAFLTGQVLDAGTFNRAAVSISDPLGRIAHGLVLSGPYPLITWAAPFLLGMWLGRQDLRASSLRARLVLIGAAAALGAYALARLLEAALGTPVTPVSWHHVIADRPHSQMPLWLLGAPGSAAMILGAALIAADAIGRLVRPLVIFGQLALTFYVAHLLALHWWGSALRSLDIGEAALHTLAMTAIAVAAAAAWRQVAARGPLEVALNAPRPLAHLGLAAARRVGEASPRP
jgi:uncharacterized membrane protein